MPNKRLMMRQIKEILRLKFEAKLSHRKISTSLKIAVGTVSTYAKRASELGLSWPLPLDITDGDLEKLLFPSPKVSGQFGRVSPDCPAMHQELKQKGVKEYKQAHGDAGYQFSQYCGYCRRHWREQLHIHHSIMDATKSRLD
jgi:hypothetical protein